MYSPPRKEAEEEVKEEVVENHVLDPRKEEVKEASDTQPSSCDER